MWNIKGISDENVRKQKDRASTYNIGRGDTSMKELRNKIIYQVFTRNFTEEGTFNAAAEKLDYLKELGVDYIYLMPVNPIGVEGRKGTLGSPYACQDYMKINPELGTEEDFVSFMDQAHQKGMKVMIDLVFNHTSRDSWIVRNHPEWMYRDEEGNFANKVGNWSDVYDLDYDGDGLMDYLVDVVIHYCRLGVDGFRFDVGSLIPSKYFAPLKKVLDRDYPDTLLLCEAVDVGFTQATRELGFTSLSDAEVYEEGFDLIYGYNNWHFMRMYLETKNPHWLTVYKSLLAYEEAFNPKDGLRIRGIENHDQKRLIQFNDNFSVMRNIAAYPVFMKGPMFIYDGLETKADHHLDLFEKDTMDFTIDEEWFSFIGKLIAFKKEDMNTRLVSSTCSLNEGDCLLLINTYEGGKKAYALINMNLDGEETTLSDPRLPDGIYVNYLDGKKYEVKNNKCRVGDPLFLFEE